ncbi:MAG: hypothetical protein JNJ88_05535, partial [Planctomycetes bacterium]|nr:hypothetical protein [Planctomycetota bacterium]
AGMNPFDPLSRPGGPKSYLWFDAAAENALKIRFVDSDGILDPVGGLDLTTLSLWAEHPLWGSGEIFWDAAALLTAIDFSTDGTEVTLTYGNMKLTKGLGFGFTASVRDLTGALGWDWHLTPQ